MTYPRPDHDDVTLVLQPYPRPDHGDVVLVMGGAEPASSDSSESSEAFSPAAHFRMLHGQGVYA